MPLYRAALDGGLDPEHEPLAVIQLASSLRNVGEAAQAVALLEAMRVQLPTRLVRRATTGPPPARRR